MSSIFKIYSPEDCDFYYDGEFKGHIYGNSDKAFRFEVERKGTYRVRFINSRYKSELVIKLNIGVDEEQDVDLDFTAVNAPIIKAEEERRRAEEERRKAAEEAERKRIAEEKRRLEAEEAERKRRVEAEKRRAEEAERRRIEAERRAREEEEEKERQRRLEEERRKIKEEAERRQRIATALDGVDECRGFCEGMALIKKDDKYGFMDIAGNVVIPIQYNDVCKYSEHKYLYNFHEGLACICKNGRYGFVDKGGNEVIPCMLLNATFFSEGLASFRSEDWREGYINKDGIQVIKGGVGDFHDGLASFCRFNKWGCIDKAGNVVIENIYDSPIHFSEGLSKTKKDGDIIFIDTNGEIVFNLHDRVDWVGLFREGLAQFKKGDERGFIDKTGSVVIKCKCFCTWNFSEGLCRFRRNDKSGYLNKQGIEVIPCVYDWAEDFSEGFALIKKNGKYGYINKQGIEIIPCIYRGGTSFSEGYAFVEIEYRKWGLIDKLGNVIYAN